ncbi:sulfurtransferase complex subunit TusB [uncultured Marinobacter sp.]|uniref:sulfurtransferase complex subunit TusB n=1 Tax=uncultured Marinobacter sp. TaxID=187379 RepID=UPI0030D9BB8D
MSATLHLLNKSPEHPRFAACLAALANGDKLVLIENAVIALKNCQLVLPATCVVSLADCQARGINPERPETALDYPALAALTASHTRIISW